MQIRGYVHTLCEPLRLLSLFAVKIAHVWLLVAVGHAARTLGGEVGDCRACGSPHLIDCVILGDAIVERLGVAPVEQVE